MAPTLRTDVSSLPPEGAELARGGPSLRSSVDANPGLLFALHEGFSILLRCLYPVAPHLAHGLFVKLAYTSEHGDLLDAPWPQIDETALQQDEIELVLQVNGKLRGSVTVPAGADKAAIEAAALASEAFIKQAAGATPKKVIVVPGRLVNIVI